MKNSKIIFLITYFAYTSIYIARINLSISGTELVSLGIADTAQIGLLGSVFSTVYACGRLINGGLSDNAPPWKMLTGGLLFAGISNIFISFFPPYAAILLFWTVNAYAQSMLWSSVICVITATFSPNDAKKRMALMVTSVATGNIIAIILNTYLLTTFGAKCCFVASIPLFFSFSALGAALLLSIIYTAVSIINTSMLSMYPLRYSKSGKAASVSGIMDFFTYFGGGISGVIYGVLIKSYGYLPMFVSWCVLSLISVFILSKAKSEDC